MVDEIEIIHNLPDKLLAQFLKQTHMQVMAISFTSWSMSVAFSRDKVAEYMSWTGCS